MTLAKRLLLGSAAALVATTGAHAADLGLPVAPSVDYVQICSIGSFTGFILPGSDVCFDISGFARFQVTMQQEWAPGANDDYDMIGVGELNFDARTMTEFGLLRGFIQLGGTATSVAMNKAFVQVGGLTAGFADSFFDPVYTDFSVSPVANGDGTADLALIGYSYSVGNGVTISLSLEDDEVRQEGSAAATTTATAGAYDESATMPDVVLAVRVDQAWGSAKLAGALHEVDPSDAARGSEFGYAIGGSALFNLPVGYTSNFGVFGTYAVGALDYAGVSSSTGATTINLGALAIPVSDFVNGTAATSIDLNSAFVIGAGFEFGLTEMLDLELDGYYTSYDDASTSTTADADWWSVRGSLAYRPVSGLEIRGGVAYSSVDFDGAAAGADDDFVSARFRITRSF